MNELIKIEKDEQEINQLSPLTWAYVGDCVFELYIRTKLINETKLKPHELHIKAINYVKAKSQAEEYGHTLLRELSFLAVHGFYHLLGYDHQTEEEEKVMFGKQEEVLDSYGITRENI